MRVLIVDDSRAMRIMLGRYLKELGFECSDAGDGKEALAQLAQLAQGALPDLMLCDWNMPEMNGFELLQAVRAESKYAGIRIVMATTETESSNVAKALGAGANEYLMKPFTKDSLQAKLELIGLVSA